MVVKILGVKRSEYKGKDGNNRIGFNYMGIKEFSAYEQENNQIEGYDVIREFTNTDYGVHAGDVVEFLYEPGFENRATLVGVRSVSPQNNPFTGEDEKKTNK